MKVLVVEDDSSVRETLGMVLEAYDHHADLVENGSDALTYLETSWPEVMLLDLTLPGMSGEEIFESIHSRFGRVPPTVVLSAAQQGAVRARHMQGAWFLAKPYTIEDLEKILREAATSSKAAQAS